MSTLSFDILATMVRKAFDPETISVTIRHVGEAERRWSVTVRDEISKLWHTFHVNLDHTLEDIKGFINKAAAELKLVGGPDKISNEIVEEGTHNHD